ncbi:homeodomain-interacting protein kinase 2-like isoform X2 [Thunnus maccoyii]|uniref:homeodomain-interacting protein kinase 2-like isoform X2 n=2 Tax=Thunnus maccoyii TaxID=8240 RepID=UPI001C4B3786|nr:homeodomain-interacting protein kinase 2-like isoform X2 [Thunnus maccoyii]
MLYGYVQYIAGVMLYGTRHDFILCLLSPTLLQSMNYHHYPTSPEWETTSSSTSYSSSSSSSQDILDVLSSPSSDYFVQSFLGEGCFGKVTKCLKTATMETVAVKMVKDCNFTDQAKNEVEILEQLRAFDSDKFNFVRYNDAFIERESVCLEFEMLDISLLDFVEKRPSCSLLVKEIRPILQQVATALQLLRSLGVAHTDIKPDNIMMVDHINQPLRVKIIDFGLARRVSQTDWAMDIQPLNYRAPEIILGFPYTAAIDMWSLGCMAAELFLGDLLYPGNCEYDMLRHIIQTQGQLPQKLLNNGVKTRCFFRQKSDRQWRLKTPFEYGIVSWTQTYFTSLDDIKTVTPVCHLSDEDIMAEIDDRENFVDLLKQMLEFDVAKRITPSQLLDDPFITMRDIAARYPDSLYLQSCSEMMDVCRHQSLSSDSSGSEVQSIQQPCPNPQASFSFTSQDQPNISLQVGSHHIWITSAIKPVGKRMRDSQSDDRCPDCISPDRKRIKMDMDLIQRHTDLPQKSKEAPSEATSREVKAKPQRKRKWDTFMASHSNDRSPDSVSPGRKRRKINPDDVQTQTELLQNSKEAPSEATSSEAKAKPQRKRTWDTFMASHGGNRSPHSTSPERKRRKIRRLQDSREAPPEAPSSEAITEPQRKWSWASFIASCGGQWKSKYHLTREEDEHG